jgi:hypothetical protein
MANIRVKDLPNTNTAADTDEFIIDSSTAGTRRLSYSELKSEISTDFAADVATYGIATLDSDNKLSASQIPDSLAQGMNFVGVANSAGDLTSTTQGDFYVIQTAFGVYSVGDQAVYDGSAYVRVVDGTKEITEGGTGATTLDDAKGNLEVPDVGTAPNEVPLNGMLGDMAYQSSEGISVGTVEADNVSVGNVGSGYSAVADKLIVGDEDGSSGMTIASGSSSTGSLFFADGTTSSSQRAAGKIVYNHSADQLQIGTVNTTAITIDSDQRVGIGTSSPSDMFAWSNQLVVGDGADHRGLTVLSATNKTGNIFFADGTGASSFAGQIQYDHTANAMVFATNGVTHWTINSTGNLVAGSGVGIDFGSTTTGSGAVATNGGLLDDYEFGDFTVTAGGTWTVTPTSMGGKYVKVGNLVTCWVTFGGSPSKTSATSGWLEGLPFATNGYPGQGSVSDTSVVDRGNCYAANVNRLWLTATSFGVNSFATVTYRHD